jgi:hypothetical protein
MEPHVYIERSRLGRTIYILRPGILNISGTRCRQRFDCDISLHEVVGRPHRLARRFYRKVVFGLAIAVPTGAITLLLVLQHYFPGEAVHHYAHFTGVVFATAIGTALTWVPSVRYLAFRNLRGDTLFEMIEPRFRHREFGEFLSRLDEAVSVAKRDHKAPGHTGTVGTIRAAARLPTSVLVVHL